MQKLMPLNWGLIQQRITPYLFLLPALVILGLTVFWPALQAFYLSFTRYEYDLTQSPQWVGFANFRRLGAGSGFLADAVQHCNLSCWCRANFGGCSVGTSNFGKPETTQH